MRLPGRDRSPSCRRRRAPPERREGRDRPDGGDRVSALAAAPLLPTYSAGRSAPSSRATGSGKALVDDAGRPLPRLRRRHRRRRARPSPSGAARSRARAARSAVARLQPVRHRARPRARRAALRAVRRRPGLLLQLGNGGERGAATSGTRGGHGPGRRDRAGGQLPRPHDRRARGDGPAREARGVRAAAPGRPLRAAERRRVAAGRGRSGRRSDPRRADPRRGRRRAVGP